MRVVFLGAVLIGLVAGGVVVGVKALTGGSSSPPHVAQAAPVGSPQATAEAFAHAWAKGDTNALYLLLDAASQRATPFPTFAAAYDTFATETTRTALGVTVSSATDGAATLAVKLTTAYFGDLEYTTNLTLTKADAAWFVAWTPAAIHPEMVDGRIFKSTVERPTRGAILDRDGAPLAVTADVRLLGLNRSIITNPAGLKAALVAFGFTQAQVDGAFNDPSPANQRVTVGPITDANREAANAILDSYNGVILYFESHRTHPLGAAAAHVVGYTRELTAEELAKRAGQGYRVGDRVGAIGIEASQDAILAGKPGGELDIVEADESTVVHVVASQPYVAGQDVRTTLSSATLVAAAAKLGDRPGAAVVIDPVTNEVLAINSSPSFDPDAFEENDPARLAAITKAPDSPQANRATTGLYSAGSTFKVITGAAGLVYGGYKTTDRLECGSMWYGVDPPRANWEGAQGMLTIAEGLMRSCNPVFYQIGLTLYNNTDGALSKMARLFGFGSPTGIVGIGEEDGLVPDAAWKKQQNGEPWYPGDNVNLAIGQGALLITPLQLANAYSSFFANDLRVPVLIAGQPATDRGELPLAPDQTALLKLGMKLVTSSTGTASAAFAFSGYNDFLGKSGTAEDVGAQSHVLFVAASPQSQPRAVCAVVLDDGQSGSIEAGPIARDIVLAALK
jgi:penicillin-binding protein 2